MKLTTYIITILATIILIFNVSKIDYTDPLSDESFTAVITSISAGCAILIVSIIRISLKIKSLAK
tara:strand:- start:113 stop:307 length:195 start_codon:yes stop_codon:yes gene_type:complete